jgi:pyridoxal phosphate enzyme (YggS family)
MTANTDEVGECIRENLVRVREKIQAAAVRSGRRVDEIRLVGVTKYVEPEIARVLVEAGVTDLGESRPQELWRKGEALADLPIQWHMIGHLQRNKVKRTLETKPVIHSVDNLRLLGEIDAQAGNSGLPAVKVLLEINISGDAAKHGLRADEIEPLLPEIAKLSHVSVVGLMAMSGLESTPDERRREFAALRELRDKLRPNCPPNVVLNELSMGMSDDFEIAIEEGATLVRVGSALFEGLNP